MNGTRQNRKLTLPAMLAAALIGASTGVSAIGSGVEQNPVEMARIALEKATGADWIVSMAPSGIAVTFAAPKDGAYALPEADGHAEAALTFLTTHRRIFGMQDPQREWVVARHIAPGDGSVHVRFSQAANAVPVYGASWDVHFDSLGRLTSMSGEYVAGALDVPTRPRLSATAAAARARACVAARARLPESAFKTGAAELEIFPTHAHPSLAWQLVVSAVPPSSPGLSRMVHLEDRSGTVLADASRGIGALGAAAPELAYPPHCLPAGRQVP